ncbi:MAG: DNRLRE domain-containing protein [Planctomycetes bacterium]|nr:DNRLRE domain-containing protein [Planctomycetota bacterium]
MVSNGSNNAKAPAGARLPAQLPGKAFLVLKARLVLLVLVFSVRSQGQTTVDLPAARDVFVSTADPAANANAQPQLFVGVNIDPKNGPQVYRSLIGFNLGGVLPTGAELESAVLRLYEFTRTSTGDPATAPVVIAPIAAAWDEKTATWNNQPIIAATPTVKSSPGASDGYKEWLVTPIVKEWLAGMRPNHGFSLRGASDTTVGGWGFRSREATADRPQLRLVYRTPPPPVRGNRAIEAVEVVKNAAGLQAVKVVWHGEAAEPQLQPSVVRDLSLEIEVEVNGAVQEKLRRALYYYPTGGPGGSPGCQDSYPACGGACAGLWAFDGGKGPGNCGRHPDPAAGECVCRSPAFVSEISLSLALQNGDRIKARLIPRPWPACPPFCPPAPEPAFVSEEYLVDDELTLIFKVEETNLFFYRRGDFNDDGGIDITDAIEILTFLFLSATKPSCLKAADVNDDDNADVSDPIVLLGYLFLGSKEPAPPFASCGMDPTPDALDCSTFSHCPGSGLIRSVTVDKSSVCPGENIHVTVLAAHPDGPGRPVEVSINGVSGNDQQVQFRGRPGPRRLFVVAGTGEGHLDTREVVVNMTSCGGQDRFPILHVQPNLFRPRVVEFVVSNASELVQGAARFVWEFDDGQIAETSVPAASHRYDLRNIRRDELYTTFQAKVTVKPAGAPEMLAQKTVALVNLYAWNKRRGFIRPPVEWEENLKPFGQNLIGDYTLTNLEDEPVTFTSRRLEARPCDARQDPRPAAFAAQDFSLYLGPGETIESAVVIPANAVPGDICGVAVHMSGQTASGLPASASLYFTARQNPFLIEPERDYDMLRALNTVASSGLVADPNRIGDEDFHRLAREGEIELPLRGRIPVGFGGQGDGVGDECTPGEALREGLTCQATSEWKLLRGFAANARKGELILSPSCGLIRAMLQRVNPPQLFAHVGIMTRHNVEITHSTTSDERYKDYPAEDDPEDLVTDGIAANVLRFGWPGAVTQPVDDAFRGSFLADPGGRTYRVGNFAWHPQLCDEDQNLVFPQVVKPLPEREAELTATLHAAADEALAIAGGQGAHYRFFSYTDGDIAVDNAFDGPDPDRRDATCCSTFVWEAFQGVGGVALEGDPEEGDDVDCGVEDGLYCYTEEERRAAANYMYNQVYDIAYGEAEWYGALFADAPDDLANQICNCLASDDCGQAALDSTAWENPGIGRTVSPDDMLRWDGVYGAPSEDLIFRSTQWVRVFRVAASAGTGSIAGHVRRDDTGGLVEDALVELVSLPGVAAARTNAAGEFRFDAIPSGMHALRATKLIGGLLYENCAVAGPAEPEADCGLVEVRARQAASAELRLGPPARNRRLVTILGQGTLTDDEDIVSNEVGERNFNVEAQVSPLEREADISVPRKCVGGEVAFEIDFHVTLLDDNVTVNVEADARLYEGTGCDTDDLEDTNGFEESIGEGEIHVLSVSLLNRGAGGGDEAFYILDIGNFQAP